MKLLKLVPILFVFLGNFPDKNLVHAELKNPKDFKVLSTNNKKLSTSNVEYYLERGDESIKDGNFEKAKESYITARELATQLASYYSDLNRSFIGVNAKIPNEMQKKGKSTLKILAEANSRLAALYIRIEKADVAVPLLIETIRIMSPESLEGKKAYETLIQIGFVETTY